MSATAVFQVYALISRFSVFVLVGGMYVCLLHALKLFFFLLAYSKGFFFSS